MAGRGFKLSAGDIIETVRTWVDVFATTAPPRDPRIPSLERPEAFIEWGGPSDFTDNSFREDAGGIGFDTDDPRQKTVLNGFWEEEGRTWEDYEVKNPEDPDQFVILRRPTEVAFKGTKFVNGKREQLRISLSYGGADQSPHYQNQHGDDFTPAVFNLLTEVEEVHWGYPILLVLFGHYPESNMSSGGGESPLATYMGLHQGDTLVNPIDLEQSGATYPEGGDEKLAHYKTVVNVGAKLASPEEDPPEDDEEEDPDGPAGDGWKGTGPEAKRTAGDYYIEGPPPEREHFGIFDGLKGDNYTGPGVYNGAGGRKVFYAGYGFQLEDPKKLDDGTWVAQFSFTDYRPPNPAELAPGMHVGGLNGNGEVFDSAGTHGGFTDPTAPKKIPPDPEPPFVGDLSQWRHELTGNRVDDKGRNIEDFWSFRLWTKKGKEEPEEDKGAPAQVVGAVINISKPLITARLLNPTAKAYTLGVRYGGVEPNDKYKSDSKRLHQFRYAMFPRGRFDDLMDFLQAAERRVGEKGDDFKYGSLDEFMNEFSPPFSSMSSLKKTIDNVTRSYDNRVDITVNLATGIDITVG